MKKKMLLGTIVLSAMTAISAWAALDSGVVAEINGKALSRDEFERRYKENIKIFKFTPPTKANVLNDIINFELGVQEAKKLKLDQKQEIQERLDAVLYQALVEEKLKDKFEKAVAVTDKDAREFCQRNPAVRTSHVFVSLPTAALKTSETKAYAKINEALAALKSGQKFEAVAAKFSEGFAQSSGGDIGFQTKDKLDPTYYAAARKLGVGSYTPNIVRSQFGLHIIKLTGVKDCNSIDIPEWQRMVYDEKRSKIFEDYLHELRSKAKVSVNQELIKE
jgi:peptidyl-prolyl cis-trans isomerase C